MDNDEKVMDARMKLESALKYFYDSCQAIDYPFADEVCDIVHDITEGRVLLTEE